MTKGSRGQGRNRLAAAVALALSLGLSACGGGTGGNLMRPDTPPPPPPTTEDPPVVQDPLAAYSGHIITSNTQPAHDAGFTGAGIVIGVVDSGVNHEHPALQGRVTDNLVYVDSSNDLSVDDAVGHGTAVAQIIAGQAFGQWPGGIAPEAKIVSARIISDEPPPDDGSGQGNEIEGALGLEPIHQDLMDRGVQIMNNSWGGVYWTDLGATAEIAAEYRPFIDNGGLVVFATGNEALANPSSIAALPSQEGTGGSTPGADLERGWLAVAALDAENPDQIADYSNTCGVARNYCLAALGEVVTTGTDDFPSLPEYFLWTGTSLAAPQVTGAAALVWEAFPYFDNDLVRQTILGTATDIGPDGVDNIYGYGRLNVGAAVQGPAKFDWGDVNVDFESITSVWANDIEGDGGLIKSGGGTLLLEGTNSYLGDTQVLGGDLVVDAANVNSNFVVGAQGRLSGRGSVKSLENGGTVALDGAVALSVTGDYHQTADATLAVDIGNVLEVGGQATLDGGTLHVLGVKDGYTTSQTETVLTAAGGVTGTFDEQTAAPGVFLTATLQYDPTSVWLNISSINVTSVQGLNYTAARQGAAARVQTAMDAIDKQIATGGGKIGGDFIAAAGQLQRAPTLASAEASLASLSGELHAAADAMTYEGIDASRRALSARFDDLGERGFAAGLWRHDLAQSGGLSRTGFSGFDYDLSGSMTGLDLRIGQRGLLGIAASHAQGSGWLDQRSDRSRSRQDEGQIYAGLVGEHGYLQGRLGFGRFDRKVDRSILLGRQQTGAATAYSGSYDVAHAEAGWRHRFGDMRLTPYVASQYARIRNDGFVESGADGFGLKVDANTGERWQAIAGLRGNRDWRFANGLWLGLEARAEWQETLAAHGTAFDASFVGVDQWQSLAGIGLADRSRLFGIGFDVGFSPDAKLRLDLSRRQASNLEDDRATLQYVVGF